MSVNDSQFNNRRRYVRVLYSQKVICDAILRQDDQEPVKLSEPLEFKAIDVSVIGIGMLSPNIIEEGTILFFKYKLDSISYNVKAQVVYCIPEENLYRIGVEFMSPDVNLENHIKRLVAKLSLRSIGTD